MVATASRRRAATVDSLKSGSWIVTTGSSLSMIGGATWALAISQLTRAEDHEVQAVEAVRGQAEEDAEVENAQGNVQHQVGYGVTSGISRVVTHL